MSTGPPPRKKGLVRGNQLSQHRTRTRSSGKQNQGCIKQCSGSGSRESETFGHPDSEKNWFRNVKEQNKILRKSYLNFLEEDFFCFLKKCNMAISYFKIIWPSSKNLESTLKRMKITWKNLKYFDIGSDSSRIRIKRGREYLTWFNGSIKF